MDNGDHTRVTMIARDRPGLFALLAGILTINHLDILSSQVFNWLDGVAVDIFTSARRGRIIQDGTGSGASSGRVLGRHGRGRRGR
jgi:UTP:GlnB (protein PII) uridylyltransferase